MPDFPSPQPADLSALRIGILGLDTSHAEAFTRLLNRAGEPGHVPGGRVVSAWAGGSPDIALSRERVSGYTATLRGDFGVKILDSPEAVAASVDAILLAALDAREHPALLARVLPFAKPVFVDKPLSLTEGEGKAMFGAAAECGVPLFSSSALRFAPAWTEALAALPAPDLLGADVHGAMSMEPSQPGYSWYGIHGIEMLFRAMGSGFESVAVHRTADHDLLVGKWADGRIGTVRGNRTGNHNFGGLLHTAKETRFVAVDSHPRPFYACLVEAIIGFFRTGIAPVSPDETMEILRFIDQANAQRCP